MHQELQFTGKHSASIQRRYLPTGCDDVTSGLSDWLMGRSSDVVLETRVLVSRRLEDKNESLGLGLGS